MIFYTSILILVVFIAILAQKKQKNGKVDLSLTLIIITILTLVSGLRYRVGTDYFGYIDSYYLDSMKSFGDIMTGSEPLFNLIVWLSSRLTYEPQIMFFIVALLTVTLIVLSIRKYSNNFSFSIFLYLATFSYFSAMNGMRQWLAVAILFYFFDLLLDKKLFKYIIVVVIASLIHSSAIFMLPIYFLVHKKHTRNFVIFSFFAGVILFFTYPFFENYLASFLGGRYGEYLLSENFSEGVKIVRVIVPFVIYMVSLFYLRKNIHYKKINMLLNITLFGLILSFLGLYSKIFFRMIIYFSVYEILIIPLFFACIGRREKMLAGLILIVSFYAYVNILWRVDSNVLPYESVFQLKNKY